MLPFTWKSCSPFKKINFYDRKFCLENEWKKVRSITKSDNPWRKRILEQLLEARERVRPLFLPPRSKTQISRRAAAAPDAQKAKKSSSAAPKSRVGKFSLAPAATALSQTAQSSPKCTSIVAKPVNNYFPLLQTTIKNSISTKNWVFLLATMSFALDRWFSLLQQWKILFFTDCKAK